MPLRPNPPSSQFLEQFQNRFYGKVEGPDVDFSAKAAAYGEQPMR